MTSIDPPPGLIRVDVPKATLLLSEAEYRRAILRGKWWKRQTALARRLSPSPSRDDAPGSPIPKVPIST